MKTRILKLFVYYGFPTILLIFIFWAANNPPSTWKAVFFMSTGFVWIITCAIMDILRKNNMNNTIDKIGDGPYREPAAPPQKEKQTITIGNTRYNFVIEEKWELTLYDEFIVLYRTSQNKWIYHSSYGKFMYEDNFDRLFDRIEMYNKNIAIKFKKLMNIWEDVEL